MQTVINHLPVGRVTPCAPEFHDETSGMANFNAQRRRELRWIDATATFCIGMVLGALIVSALFLLTNLNQH